LSCPLAPSASATPPFPPPPFYFAFAFFGVDLADTITSSLLDVIKAGVALAPRMVGERERAAEASRASGRRREVPRSERLEEASISGTGDERPSGGADEHQRMIRSNSGI
jgi:hypothetical protein